MLAIRLQRIGKKNRPSYRVVVSEKKRDLYGKHNEILGNYDPLADPKVINLKSDRIKHWLSQGAQPSATVHNLLVKQGVIEGKKVKAWAPKKKKEDKKEDDAKKDGDPSTPSASADSAQDDGKKEEKQAEEPAKEESKPEETKEEKLAEQEKKAE